MGEEVELKPLRIRQWIYGGAGEVVEIRLTRAAEADEMERVTAAVHAFSRALAGSTPAEESSVVHVDDLNDPILVALANPEPGQCSYCLERDGKHAAGCDAAPAEESAVYPAPAGWRLVPEAATDVWRHSLANLRQGRSSTPRCEAPGQYELGLCREIINEVLAAAPKPEEDGNHG